MEQSEFVTHQELLRVLIAQYEWVANMGLTTQSIINLLLTKELTTREELARLQATVRRTRQGAAVLATLESLRNTKTVEEFLKEFQGTVQ